MMPIRTRLICCCSCFIAGIALCDGIAHAQTGFPNRTVRIVLPTPPGGGGDTLGRLLAQAFSERWGRQVVIDNRTGASGMIAGEMVAKSPPDGHTLFQTLSTFAMLPSMHKKLPYDTLRDFVPITLAASLPNIILFHPSLPARSVKDMIALAKARPGLILYASAGQGTSNHLAMELFSNMAQIRLVHVPYKSAGTALVDLIAGQVGLLATNMIWGVPHVRTGKLRTLGITSLQRSPVAPEIPTVAESGLPGFEHVQWYGLLAPAGTPAPIVDKIYRDATAVLKSPEAKERLATDGANVIASTPDEFAAFLRAEIAKWAAVIKTAGITAE